MKTVLHKSETRGHSVNDWLDTRHTFNFGDFYNPERARFGVLRVLNDDIIKGGTGFHSHPHQNMEIITIPLSGVLEHRDNKGNVRILKENDVQVMSAGRGIVHAEMNHNPSEPAAFLQIWIFPREKDMVPRYDQASYNPDDQVNRWQRIVSPDSSEKSIWIHQDARMYLTRLSKDFELEYTIKHQGAGVYLFMIDGSASLNGDVLTSRDGMGISETDRFTVRGESDARILAIEVPMR
ncbi:MAG: pirin family protein [Bacteroidota bacterium]